MIDYINKNEYGVIKKPHAITEDIKVYQSFIYNYYKKNGVIPDKNEIMNYLDISEERLLTIENIVNNKNEVSFENYRNEEDNTSRGFDNTENEVFEHLLLEELNEIIYGEDSPLSLREKMILEHRYGLNDKISKNKKQTGEFFNISYARVNDIEKKALEKIRQQFKVNSK